MKGTLTNGFEYNIDEKYLDNMELVDALSEIEDNPLHISKVCTLLFGKDQKKKLYDHLRDEDGRVPVEAVTQAVVEIFNAQGEAEKN